MILESKNKISFLLILPLMQAFSSLAFKYYAMGIDEISFTQLFIAPVLWLGIFLLCIRAMLWTQVLVDIDLSTAYPFMSMNLIFTFLFGLVFFEEPFSIFQVVGLTFLLLGVYRLYKTEL